MLSSVAKVGLSNRDMVRLVLGEARLEGQYEVNLYAIALRDGTPDT
jgi:hypothetical protein